VKLHDYIESLPDGYETSVADRRFIKDNDRRVLEKNTGKRDPLPFPA
jgi:hypothetical protein